MSSFIKSKLKAARDSIGKKDYKSAEEAAVQVLEYEPANYNANVFLGLACLEQGDLSKSEQAYIKATEIAPDQPLAWQGLSKFYERVSRWQDCATALRRLADVFSRQDDAAKCAEMLQKFIELQREHGTRQEIIDALGLVLPSSPLYGVLSNLPEPDPTAPMSTNTFPIQVAIYNSLPTLEEIVSLTEKDEEEKIKKEVDKRRMRLGAGRPEDIKKEVGREVWEASSLPLLFHEILNHPNTSDELRRLTESKLLRRKYQHLEALPLSKDGTGLKQKLLAEVEDLSKGAVLLGLPDELAWMIFINGVDAYDIEEYNFRTLRRFCEIFPQLPLTRMIHGYFDYMNVPNDLEGTEEDDESSQKSSTVDNDPFTFVLDAAADGPSCLLSHRILSELYRAESDYENAIKSAENGLKFLTKVETDQGKQIPRKVTRRAFNVVLVVGLAALFPPKHHDRCMDILSEVLHQEPTNIPCLISKGTVLQYRGQWSEAEHTYKRVLELESDYDSNLAAKEEWAWCIVKGGRVEEGIEELKQIVQTLDEDEGKMEQKARAWWRLGKSLWDTGDEGREVAYKHFITSLKRSSIFAPAFTSLGIYYADVVSPPDLDRSSKCFQKAFELDAREAEAARRLAEGFAEEREWDLVDVVARRTIEGEGGLEGGSADGGKVVNARYLPTNAWAWKAVGVVELHRRNYSAATQSFQVALRADQDDFISWQRLGECYAKSGRHAAAIKALKRALELQPDDWMCLYLLGDVYKLMGQYTSAIEVFETVLKHHPEEICVLMSLAESHLIHARIQYAEGFHSRAEVSLAASLTVALVLLQKSPGFRRITWKTAADAAYELSKAASFNEPDAVRTALADLACLIGVSESGSFTNNIVDFPLLDEKEEINGFSALKVALAAYDYRVSLDSLDNNVTASAWFDLGMAMTQFSTQTKDKTKSTIAIEQAKILIQKALAVDPDNEVYWNVLGNLDFVENPKVSQDAYIKALGCDSKSVVTWTNLGLLYLFHGDAELANEALYRAQTLDPDYALAWIGQGLVATVNEHHQESHALFQHAITLSSDVPAADLGFSKRAFERLAGPNVDQLSTREMLLPPFHALDRYCKQRPDDAAALHLFALVCERLDQMELAVDLVTKTIALLERLYEETEDAETEQQFVLANGTLGRLRLANKDFTGAVDAFNIVLSLLSTEDETFRTKTLRAHAQFSSGVANFRLGELETALEMFESSLGELPLEMIEVRGHVTILLAQTLWAMGGDEARQTACGQLLECISSDPQNLSAMTALVAMGILDSDDSLVNAALSEIQALTLDKRAELDPGRTVSRLLVQHHLAQGREQEAISESQRAVHSDILDSTSRRALAELLLQQKQTAAAAAVISVNRTTLHETLNDTLRISAVAVSAGAQTNALQLAQKSVFIAPWKHKNWLALCYVRCVENDQ